MHAHIIFVLAKFFLLILAIFLNIQAAQKTVATLLSRAISEYHLHRCGRTLSAIANFRVIATHAVSLKKMPKDIAEKTLEVITSSLKNQYHHIYRLGAAECVNFKNSKPEAIIYKLNDGRGGILAANFSYRLLPN